MKITDEDGVDGPFERAIRAAMRDDAQKVRVRTPSLTMEETILDHALRLPTAARAKAGMATDCDACGEAITDEYFYGGFSAGRPNLKLHERCTPASLRTAPTV
jgi:hypothetical protein